MEIFLCHDFYKFSKTVLNYYDFLNLNNSAKVCNLKQKIVFIRPNRILMKVYEVKFIDYLDGQILGMDYFLNPE